MVPLTPYFFASSVRTGLAASALVTMIALFGFGFVKARFTGAPPVRGAFQTVLIGALAAGAAFLIARAIA
jgi:vacuolar iron transporter family protein